MSRRLAELPGVRSVADVHAITESEGSAIPSLVVDDRAAETRRKVPIDLVSASYFETIKLPLLQGRAFRCGRPRPAAIRPIVISDALANMLWPRGGAIGAHLTADDGGRYEVTGIVHPDVAFAGGTADRQDRALGGAAIGVDDVDRI
jgi:MacB-like protein